MRGNSSAAGCGLYAGSQLVYLKGGGRRAVQGRRKGGGRATEGRWKAGGRSAEGWWMVGGKVMEGHGRSVEGQWKAMEGRRLLEQHLAASLAEISGISREMRTSWRACRRSVGDHTGDAHLVASLAALPARSARRRPAAERVGRGTEEDSSCAK